MASLRSKNRDVFLYTADNEQQQIGGLVLTKDITNRLFYSMVRILILEQRSIVIKNEIGNELQQDDAELQPGKYYVDGMFRYNLAAEALDSDIKALCPGYFMINNEVPLIRAYSTQSGSRLASYRSAVLERDRKCLVTGVPAFDSAPYLHAAHIFPLAFEGHWITQNYKRWIAEPSSSSDSKINSARNGLTLRSDVHAQFDAYAFAINPDDHYKIVCFQKDPLNIAGGHLDPDLLTKQNRPPDELFRWHFRQAVLVNMKGEAGEPQFDADFPPGSDVMGEIMNGPKPAARMEFELFDRLAGRYDPLVSM